MTSATITIRTHYQISDNERSSRDPGMRDYAWSKKKAASWTHHRNWTNTTKDRLNGGYHFFGPGWLLAQMVETVTGSIVWGACGRMSDMPEY